MKGMETRELDGGAAEDIGMSQFQIRFSALQGWAFLLALVRAAKSLLGDLSGWLNNFVLTID
jgi:hypothetical protein